MNTTYKEKTVCFHCGEDCHNRVVISGNNSFCCEGCKMVYQLLNEKGMCEYYNLNKRPGTSQRRKSTYDKFAFLDDDKVQQQLISFRDSLQTHVTFYLPQVHCSSCLWLLENLHRVNDAIVRSEMNFPRKELSIIFNHHQISLKQVAELLTSVGYEPYISLQQAKQIDPSVNRKMIYRLGVAGFCFANIMLLSFPEYLGISNTDELQPVFRIFSLILSLPVFFYSTRPFFETAWKGLKHKFLHIDAPVAFAILVTFLRSVYEVLSGTGSGYFDSMSGIVFFMLAGRVLQDRTSRRLSFTRDYRDYFPMAATVVKNEKEVPVMLHDIRHGDTLRVHHEELIPADGILTRGRAFIDYSFVTGESLPVMKEMGEIIYAGGKQTGSNIELLVIKEVAQSYLTSLWNRDDLKPKEEDDKPSFVHVLSRHFSLIVFGIAIAAGIYWQVNDPSRVWSAVTAVLIVACPCALLLSSSFCNGNLLNILARNKCYLRSAGVIEKIADTQHIVFDKTGTLTWLSDHNINYSGTPLSGKVAGSLYALVSHSSHPLSKALMKYLEPHNSSFIVQDYREEPGYGLEGLINGRFVKIGSAVFVMGREDPLNTNTRVYVEWEGNMLGFFTFANHYRRGMHTLFHWLKQRFRLSVVSGDNDAEFARLKEIAGGDTTLLFNRKPAEKLQYVEELQLKGNRVMMIGDGLNDAGALCKSDVGIAITEHSNNFTPASDVIMEADQLKKLPAFIRICRLNKKVILAAFIFSIAYNLIGLLFAVTGTLSPFIAAILMPSSSLSVLFITFGITSLISRRLKL